MESLFTLPILLIDLQHVNITRDLTRKLSQGFWLVKQKVILIGQCEIFLKWPRLAQGLCFDGAYNESESYSSRIGHVQGRV